MADCTVWRRSGCRSHSSLHTRLSCHGVGATRYRYPFWHWRTIINGAGNTMLQRTASILHPGIPKGSRTFYATQSLLTYIQALTKHARVIGRCLRQVFNDRWILRLKMTFFTQPGKVNHVQPGWAGLHPERRRSLRSSHTSVTVLMMNNKDLTCFRSGQKASVEAGSAVLRGLRICGFMCFWRL